MQLKGTQRTTLPTPTFCKRQSKKPRWPVQGHTQLEADAKLEWGFPVQCSFLFGKKKKKKKKKKACVCMSAKKGSDMGQFLERSRQRFPTPQTVRAWLTINSKVVKAERLSPTKRTRVAFFLLQRQSKTSLPSKWPLLSDMFSTYPSEAKWAQVPSSEELSTESSLKWSQQLAERLQRVGSPVNRLNIITLLHTLNRTLLREWNGIL